MLRSFASKYAIVQFLPGMPVTSSEFSQFAGSLCLETRSTLTVETKANGSERVCWSLCARPTHNFVVELQIIEYEIVAVIPMRESPMNLILLIRLTYSPQNGIHKRPLTRAYTCRDGYCGRTSNFGRQANETRAEFGAIFPNIPLKITRGWIRKAGSHKEFYRSTQ